MSILVPAVVAILLSTPALAARRENTPFRTANGRTVLGAGAGVGAAAGPRGSAVDAFGGAAANAPSSGQGMIGFSPTRAGRGFRAGQAGRTFRAGPSRRAAGADEAPPYFSKPGALIRDTGQLPKYEKAEAPMTHTVDAGEIVLNRRKAFDVGRAPGVLQGAKDTLPPPNPGTGTGYASGAAANSAPATGGHDNNGSGNNGAGLPGDDIDSHGGDKLKDAGFYDAF